MKKSALPLLVSMMLSMTVYAQWISEKPAPGSFVISSSGINVSIYVDPNDFKTVQTAGGFLQQDIENVIGKKPELVNALSALSGNIIIIGSIQKSSLIQQLIQQKKINVSPIKSKWEAYQIQTVRNPFKGVDNALVICGSDRRGAAYGVFELSLQMGVSPWYWWADIPVKKKKNIYIKKGLLKTDAPKVKYRGIFLNDEAPALSGWSKEKFGGFNHLFYEKVFELMLRLKANYLWPAMWGNAFYDDDSLNKQAADKYGIVIGTSHHEPLMRAHDEWKRYGSGKWNYDSNEIRLKKFWREGMERVQGTETIVSVGMRGDGDEPMTQGVAIALLEKIVNDQREIIRDISGRDASITPQLWALYKEVQDYYDKGMRVPDDVTLLLCDDNWGNIRKLPGLNEKKRAGGYGIYYHFDYVGDPRNYKWINTNNIARVWEQMHLAYAYGVDKIWIVNVGDLKPMEFPVSFFLDYAWNPGSWNEDGLATYYTNWARQQFGKAYAKQIGEIIQKYTQYNARRKPELLSPETYSLSNFNEADLVISDYEKLVNEAEKINLLLTPEYRDAFFQLVLHPVTASANLNELYITVARNKWYAERNDTLANRYADRAKQLYLKDSLISFYYNHICADGKWNHLMDQTHIGYTYWQQPPVNKMPAVEYVLQETVDPHEIKTSSGSTVAAQLVPKKLKAGVFYEKDGYVSIQAAHYTRVINTPAVQWKIIPGIGRDGSGLTTFPVTSSLPSLSLNGPCAEYSFFVYDSGRVTVDAYFSPTLNYPNKDGLKYAVSLDDEQPQIISINNDGNQVKTWENWVANNIIIKTTHHLLTRPGNHVLKYRMISAAVVLQKIVIDLGGLRPSYLGPPETIKK